MQFLRLICWFAILVYSISADLTTRERIELHKKWLESRAAFKALYETNNNTNNLSYFKKMLKLKSDYKPYSLTNTNNNNNNNINNNNNNNNNNKNNNNNNYYINKNNNIPNKKYEYKIFNKQNASKNDVLQPDEQIFVKRKNVPTPTPKHSMQIINLPSLVTTTTTPISSYTKPTTIKPSTTTQSINAYVTTTVTPSPTTTTTTTTTTTLPPTTTTTAAAITLTTQSIQIKPNVISSGKQNITKLWKKPKRRMSMWGNWEKWTTCSRTCGGGVMSQSRNCIYRPVHNQTTNSGNRLSKDCIGLYRRYRICNEQNCSDADDDTDFREQQCIYYNTQIFRGKQYEWEAYIKDDAECELNCKPIGMSYFATLNETVIDGTLCTRPTEYLKRNYYGRAICVEGTCKAVHASGIITGAFMNSGAVRCGVLICRPVTGLYTKNPLPNGYVHIATIPAGASNISITELKNSMNFLVLKSGNQKFIINGDFSVSLSGIYEASGALFDYRRIDGLINGSHHINRKIDGVTEWITSTGPITEPIHLMVLAQESNPGIKYEYLLPINSVSSSSEEISNSYEYTSGETEQPITTLSTSDQIGKHTLKSGAPSIVHANITMPMKRKRKFLWKVIGFSACSKSCGGGIQSPIIRCVREAPTRIFAAKRCSHLIKPILNENLMRCNTQPCPAYWKIDEWTDCNCGKHNEQIFQSRVIKCVQELGTGMVIQVNIGACLEDEPTFRQKCDCPKIKKHKHNHHELNSIKNRINGIANGGSGGIAGDIDSTGGGNGATKPSVSLISNSSISKRAHTADNKKNGIWLVSEWNQQCSTDCGDGIQYRSIFCDRSAPTIERCDLRFTPDTTRQCTVTNKCNVGDWFIGPWSQCSGDCFNLTKSRSVFCIKDEEIVSESECNIGSEKPDILQSCGLDEVPDCRPRWHYSEWTECTKKCGGGTQRRTVKCFQPNIEEKQMKDSKNCKYVERPQAYRNCNTFNCESTTQSQPIDPRVDLIQNDIEPVCKDEFPNCNLVVEAHLCNYSYYEAHCCETCRKRS